MTSNCCEKCFDEGVSQLSYGGCCNDSCECHTQKPYNQIDHSHCWTSTNPPCGQKVEHLRCCLCGIENPKAPAPQKDGWEERLQIEVMEDYLRCVEMDGKFTSRNQKAHMEEMRAHWDKLKDFIRTEITKAYEEAFRAAADLVEHWHYKKGGYTELAEKIRDLIKSPNGSS